MSRPIRLRRAAHLAARAGFIALLVVAAAMVVLPLAGYHRYVITYRPPPGAGPTGLVTHRIASIRTEGGRRVFRTKGDGNAAADPWTFQLEEPTQARVAFHVPHLGRVLAVASDRTNRTIVVGLLALLVVAATLSRLWRDAGQAMQESVA